MYLSTKPYYHSTSEPKGKRIFLQSLNQNIPIFQNRRNTIKKNSKVSICIKNYYKS